MLREYTSMPTKWVCESELSEMVNSLQPRTEWDAEVIECARLLIGNLRLNGGRYPFTMDQFHYMLLDGADDWSSCVFDTEYAQVVEDAEELLIAFVYEEEIPYAN